MECNTGKVAVNIRVLEKANTQFTLAFYNRYRSVIPARLLSTSECWKRLILNSP